MAGKYIDNSAHGLPDAKNALMRRDGYIEMILNGGAGGSVKVDEASLHKIIDSSWSISVSSSKTNNYVSATIAGNRVACHRLILDMVDRPDVKLEFVSGDKFDCRVSNIQFKSIGNIQRSAEAARDEIAKKMVKAVSALNDTEVRSEVKQMALNNCAEMLSVLYSIAVDPAFKASDRIVAAKEVLVRGVGPAGDEPLTGASLPHIEISFAQPVQMAKLIDSIDAETVGINIQSLVPIFTG